ncbi:MAG: hypothetical protein AAGH79_10220 [Bacteroidota bacterium]
MYDYLLKYVSPKAANVLIVVWYFVLVFAILYLMVLPEGELRYVDY